MKRKRNVGTLVDGQARESTVWDQIELKLYANVTRSGNEQTRMAH